MTDFNRQDLFFAANDCQEFAALLDRKYATFIKERYFEVEVTRDRGEVCVKVTLRNQTGSFYYPVEARLKLDDHPQSAREAGVFLLDYVDAYFDEYLRSGGEVYLPIDWAEYECEGVTFQLKGQILNLEMERLGDLWLEGKIADLPPELIKH